MPISGSPTTAGSQFGIPVAADYTSDKSGDPSKEFLGRVTKNTPLGIPMYFLDNDTRIYEQRDIVFTISKDREGDGLVTEDPDNVVASGLSGSVIKFSNEWFNQYWFNNAWFNSTWFNNNIEYVGNANITEDGDGVSATGKVGISGDGAATEAHDTTDTYGSVGNDVVGEAFVFEDRDVVTATGDVTIHANAYIIERKDTVSATGSGNVINTLLSWAIYGGMTQIDIYRSTDNITFTHLQSVSGTTTSYIDTDITLGQTYYYYLVGKQTTGADTDQSDTESITIPN